MTSFSQQFITRLVRNFNYRKATAFRYNSKKMKDYFQKIYDLGATENSVTDLLLKSSTYDLYEIFDDYIETLKGLPHIEEVPEKKLQQVFPTELKEDPRVETKDMTLGLIEQALGQVILDKYVPQITAKIDEYVKSTYGNIKKRIDYVVTDKGKLENEVTHEEFETVLNFVMADEPVMLVGPAGTGKNVICKQVSKALELDFYFSNAITQEFKLTGFIDAMGKYHETEFYRAFTKGGLFLLDEIDASIPEVLVILNSAIANRYFDFPTGKVDAHPDFRIIAAGNTFGLGASYEYVGRNQLDAASLNRFAVVEINYSTNIENAITDNVELIKFIRNFRNSVQKAGIHHIVSYRELGRIDKMLQTELSLHKIFRTCLIKNLEQDDLRMIYNDLDKDNKYTTVVNELCY